MVKTFKQWMSHKPAVIRAVRSSGNRTELMPIVHGLTEQWRDIHRIKKRSGAGSLDGVVEEKVKAAVNDLERIQKVVAISLLKRK